MVKKKNDMVVLVKRTLPAMQCTSRLFFSIRTAIGYAWSTLYSVNGHLAGTMLGPTNVGV
jgi:hypothetical protein